MSKKKNMTYVVGEKYSIVEKIGEGAFGKIFSGVNKNTGENVAVKIERGDTNTPLRNEARMYSALRGVDGIPNMRAWGSEGKFNYLVLDLLGESLEDTRVTHGGAISLKLVMSIASQMLMRIRDVHKHGIIHRDVKPSNFMFGKHSSVIYLIDFGLAKVYREKNRHVKKSEGRSVIGTATFISIHTHDGIQPSRRDDLESIGYIMLFLLLGNLPWQDIECDDERDRQRRIGIIKKQLDLWHFSSVNNIPNEIIIFIDYCRNLSYEEEPKYDYLFSLLQRE